VVFVVVACLALTGVYFVVRAPRLAHDEATTFAVLRSHERFRRFTYWLIGAMLIAVAAALLVDAVN
jgi:hypothetical protein